MHFSKAYVVRKREAFAAAGLTNIGSRSRVVQMRWSQQRVYECSDMKWESFQVFEERNRLLIAWSTKEFSEKPLKRYRISIAVCDHRAKAAVLIRRNPS